MKGVAFLRKFTTSTWFLAGIPALVITTFVPSLGTSSRLLFDSVDKNTVNYVYADINYDSISEVIHSGKGLPYYFIIIQNNDLRVYDQWNFKDTFDPDVCDFFFGNYDNDNFKEIYAFTTKDDSLFLNINEFFDPQGEKSDRIYITNIGFVNKKVTSNIWPAGFYDTDGNGTKELYFSIQTGFGLEPRRLYCYDIGRNELKTSDLLGVICQSPYLVDVDGDGRPEIFGKITASGNYKTWVPYTDRSSWLMVFDDKLKFKFPPVEFPGLTNELLVSPFFNNGLQGYLLTHNTGSADSAVMTPRIMLYSTDGKKIRERIFSDLGISTFAQMVVVREKDNDRIFLMGKFLIELNEKLESVKKVRSPFNSIFNVSRKDIDFDGQDELILYSPQEERLVVYETSLKKIVDTKLKATYQAFRFSHYSAKDHENKIFMRAGDYGYFLKLKGNWLYYLGYAAYPGIYFLFYFFIHIVKKINTYQVEQSERLKQRLITLQLKGIKAQLDPHFTFNTLNSVASLLYLDDRKAAYDYLNKFTQLLRSMLNDAERIYRSLGEELDFVITYLDLEKLRFGDKFKFEIHVGEAVDLREQVPKLVLHTFAENAVKHGISPSPDGGILIISVDKEDGYLKLSIQDNGIGREKAEGQSKSTGKGLKLTGEFYDILNQINKKPIIYTITDLFHENGQAAGTRVDVSVPVDVEQDRRQARYQNNSQKGTNRTNSLQG